MFIFFSESAVGSGKPSYIIAIAIMHIIANIIHAVYITQYI